MKRRKFIEATLLAVPAASSAAGMRLYGTPGSVAQLARAKESEKLLLPISKSGLPPEFWSKIKSVTSIVDNVLKSQEEGEAFYSAPGNYLASHGLDSSDATLQEESVKLVRSEEHTSELQSLMRSSYAVFCLKKNKKQNNT